MSNRWSRYVAVAAATALSAGIALLGPANTAQAASSTTMTGPTVVYGGTNRTVAFTFTVTGTPTSVRASTRALATNVAASYAYGPGTPSFKGTQIGVPSIVELPIYSYTTPGVYRFTVQAIESGVATSSAYRDITVLAGTSYSRSHTSSSISGKVGRTRRTTFKVWAPRYQAGASAKVYYKFKGTKKYVKVAQGRLNSTGYAKMLTKKGKIRKAGYYYIKLSGVRYAGGYSSKSIKTYIRSY